MTSRRILVVDDENVIVEFLQALIRGGPDEYIVETANTGQEAIRKAHDLRPHLVVLDINIPGGNGFDVCESVSCDAACRHTVVLAMTADANPERTRRIEALGARECLTKPFSLNEFIQKVRRYTDESIAREAAVASTN
jgi:CheY-like chemotaxis protein